jgi:hypothetical protein
MAGGQIDAFDPFSDIEGLRTNVRIVQQRVIYSGSSGLLN